MARIMPGKGRELPERKSLETPMNADVAPMNADVAPIKADQCWSSGLR
jgi:hypothetical protein